MNNSDSEENDKLVLSSDEVSTEDQEVLQRLLDHQVEQIRHFENRAERIIRIFLAMVGVVIGGLSIVFTSSEITISSLLSQSLIPPGSVQQVTSQLASSTPLNINNATGIVFILFLSLFTIPVVCISLTVSAASSAWKTISPDKVMASKPQYRLADDVSSLDEMIEYNSRILERKRTGLQNVLDNIVRVLTLLIAGLILFVFPFAVKSPGLVLVSLLVVIFGAPLVAIRNNWVSTIRFVLKPRVYGDGAVVLIFTSILSSNFLLRYPLRFLVYLPAGLAVYMVFRNVHKSDLLEPLKLLVKYLTLSVLSVLLFLFVEVSTNATIFWVGGFGAKIVGSVMLGYLSVGVLYGLVAILVPIIMSFLERTEAIVKNPF